MSANKKAARALVLTKAETVYGMAPEMLASLDALILNNADFQPITTEQVDRNNVRPNFGGAGKVVTNRYSSATYSVEMSASVTVGTVPAYNEILKACGFSETITAGTSVVYAPVSSGHGSMSMKYFLDGLVYLATGVRADLEIVFEEGQIPMINVTQTGLYNAPVDAVLPTDASFARWGAARPFNSRNITHTRINSFDVALRRLSVRLGNDVQYIDRGTERVEIVQRNCTGQVAFETTAVADQDWYGKIESGTTVPISIFHGKVDQRGIRFLGQRAYLTNPRLSADKGVSITTCDVSFSTGLAGVGDDISLTYN